MDTPRSDDLSMTSMQVVELKRKLDEERDGYRRKLQVIKINQSFRMKRKALRVGSTTATRLCMGVGTSNTRTDNVETSRVSVSVLHLAKILNQLIGQLDIA